MRIWWTGVAALALLSTFPLGAGAASETCRDASEHYHAAKRDVAEALHRYADCLRDSDGHDDCSSEFSTLRSAQDDFESAVSTYESDCD